MKKVKRFVSVCLVLMLLLSTFSVGVFAAAVNTQPEDIGSTANLTELETKIAQKGLNQANMISLLSAALRSAGKDMTKMTVRDVLNLPADILDDVVTYIFAGLKALGVEVDALYENMSNYKLINWFVNTYYRTDNILTELETKISQKGLVGANMMNLLSVALRNAGKDMTKMTVYSIFNLPADILDDVVTYIFAGLKALGVEVDTVCEKMSNYMVINWFVNTYYQADNDLIELETKIAQKGLTGEDMMNLLTAALRSNGKDVTKMTAYDILNLPANIMDGVALYIFAGLKALGFEVDEIYEKLTYNKVINWFVNTYYQADNDLIELETTISQKGLYGVDLMNLLTAALRSAGKDIAKMTVNDILDLPANVMDDVVLYIFAGLKALGFDVDELYEKMNSDKVMNWFVNSYYVPVPAVSILVSSNRVPFGKEIVLSAAVFNASGYTLDWYVDGKKVKASGDELRIRAWKKTIVTVKVIWNGTVIAESESEVIVAHNSLLQLLFNWIQKIVRWAAGIFRRYPGILLPDFPVDVLS